MSSFCDSGGTTQSTNTNQWVDPLGPSSINGKTDSYASTGAPQFRNSIFNYLGGTGGTGTGQLPSLEQAGQTAGSAATTAANNPAWANATDLANNTILGNYLGGSPELTAQENANTASQLQAAGNSNARARSNFAENGMSYGTPELQAEQANNAAAAATAGNTNANLIGNNYENQSALQQNAVNNLSTATGTPLNYLSSVSTDTTQPLSQLANIISGLSSGGQVIQTGSSGVESTQPSTASDVMNGIGVGGSLIGDL